MQVTSAGRRPSPRGGTRSLAVYVVKVSGAVALVLGLAVCKTTLSKPKIVFGEADGSGAPGKYPAVVGLTFFDDHMEQRVGSAMVVGPGLLLTNGHVALKIRPPLTIFSSEFSVTTKQGILTYETEVHPNYDLARTLPGAVGVDVATIKLSGELGGLGAIKPLQFSAQGVAVADRVTLVGFGRDEAGVRGYRRYGFNRVHSLEPSWFHAIELLVPRLASGALGRCWNVLCFRGRDQTGGFEGDSGGALLDRSGRLVGMIQGGDLDRRATFAVNFHDTSPGGWLAAELNKQGVSFTPAGYDALGKPLPAYSASEARSRGQSAPMVEDLTAALSESDIIDDRSGDVVARVAAVSEDDGRAAGRAEADQADGAVLEERGELAPSKQTPAREATRPSGVGR